VIDRRHKQMGALTLSISGVVQQEPVATRVIELEPRNVEARFWYALGGGYMAAVTAKSPVNLDHVVYLFLPPYRPKLKPIECLWKDV
jgi:hypothetical protein